MSKIIGIDLGTSNTAAAVLEGGKPTIIPSAEGTSLGGKAFPSYVAFAKDGQLRFIDLRRSSGVTVLDDYAVNAVKLASPFPPIPDAMSRTGIPVVAVFNYIIEGSLYNVLR